jgi:hypothetical protein
MRTLKLLSISLLLAITVSAQGPAARIHGTVNEVMIGIIYPSSNIVFAAQSEDPEAPSDDFSFDYYGGWVQVESAAIAVAESANLLTIPGRLCANGTPPPVDAEDWLGWVEDMRTSGIAAYDAAKSQSQEALTEITDQLATSCSSCHAKYVDVADRCVG